jgi:hypothetical protein
VPTRRCWALVATCLAVAAAARVAVAAPEACATPSAGEARAAAAAAAAWLVANQRPDGSYRYAVDPGGRDLGGYSIVRHAGVTMSLYQAAGAPGADPRLLAAADRALGWMLDRLARGDGWRALADGSYAPLGGSALMVAALAQRRLLTGERTHDGVMRDLGAFLVAMQRDDGDFFVAYDVRAAEPDREGVSQYFAGEALWALARLHESLPDARFERAARDAARFVSTGRDDRDFVPVPPLNDHWAAYGFAEMADWPIDDHSARYARAARAVPTAHPLGSGQGSGRAVLVDARAAAAGGRARHVGRGAGRAGPARARRRAPRRPARPGTRQHRVRQRRARAAPGPPRRPARARRVVHRRGEPHGRPAARDLGTARVRGSPRAGGRTVNVLALALMVLVVLDPVAASVAASTLAPGSARAAGRVTIVGAAVAVAAVLLGTAALAAEPVLDWLDVSVPAALLAAGIVVLVPAVEQLWHGPEGRVERAPRASAVRLGVYPLAYPSSRARPRSSRWWRGAARKARAPRSRRWRSRSRRSPPSRSPGGRRPPVTRRGSPGASRAPPGRSSRST